MTDTPKFTVVDRRKFRADEEMESTAASVAPAAEPPASTAPDAAPKTTSTPRLTLVEPQQPSKEVAVAVEDEPIEEGLEQGVDERFEEGFDESQLPPAPTAEESRFQKLAYDKAAERLDDLVRAQNPGIPAAEKIGFEHLVQQLYLSAMMQMGAGTPDGQRPRIDILGARQTIDLLEVLLNKSAGNLTAEQTRTLETVLYEVRMTFLELTRMIAAQAQAPLPPAPGAGPGSGAKR